MIYQLKPIFIEKLWGGHYYSKLHHLNKEKIGEVVLFSTHLDYPLIVLTENEETLLKVMNPKLYQQVLTYFPITIKLIDAQDDLSIQVHPDDTYARKHHQSPGKEEYWMILDALPSSVILIGHSINDSNILKDTVLNGKLHQYMNHYPIKKGNTFYIPANTVHAIQKNTRLLEIAQASILNFRVDDYQRRDENGHERDLHLKEALEVMDKFNSSITTDFPEHLFHQEITLINGKTNITLKKGIAIGIVLEGEGHIHNFIVREGHCCIISQESNLGCDGNLKLMLIYSSL